MIVSSLVTMLLVGSVTSCVYPMYSPQPSRVSAPSLASLAAHTIKMIVANPESSSYKKVVTALSLLSPESTYGYYFLKAFNAHTLKDTLALQLLECAHTLHPISSPAHVYFKHDGTTLISDSCTKEKVPLYQIWNTSTGKEVLRCVNGIGLRAGDATQKYYVSFPHAERSWVIFLHDNKTKKIRHTLVGHTAPITCVAFSPNKKTIATASQDHTIKLWNIKTGTVLETLMGHDGPVTHMDFSPYAEFLASCSEDKTVRLWETNHGVELRYFSFAHAISSVVLSPRYPFMAVGLSTGAIALIDLSAHTEIKTLKEHTNAVTWLAFNHEGTRLASVSDDQTIKLWHTDTTTAKKLKKLSALDIYLLHLNLKDHPLYEKINLWLAEA